MKSSLTDIAMWALNPKRPDLIVSWFESLQQKLREMRVKAQELTYGGVEGDVMPVDVYAQVDRLRTQALYLYFLATSTLQQQQSHWDDGSAESILSTANRCTEEMKLDAEAIATALALIAEVSLNVTNITKK